MTEQDDLPVWKAVAFGVGLIAFVIAVLVLGIYDNQRMREDREWLARDRAQRRAARGVEGLMPYWDGHKWGAMPGRPHHTREEIERLLIGPVPEYDPCCNAGTCPCVPLQ